MIQEDNININSANIKQWMIYLEEAKELNAFVKENFGKEEISGMSIAPIIKDLHKENEIIEKAINAYKNRNQNPFELDAYYATEYDTDFTGRPHKPGEDGCVYYEVIHVLKGSKRGKKHAMCIERFKYKKSSDSENIYIEASGPSFGTEELDYPMSTYTDLFYAERLVKVSEITWEHCKRIYEGVANEKITF